MGITYGELGDYERGLDYKVKALDVTRDTFGEKHPDTAKFLNNVGMTYRDLGDVEKGREYLEKSLEIKREIFGDMHPDTARSLQNLGTIYTEIGDPRRGLEYEERALQIIIHYIPVKPIVVMLPASPQSVNIGMKQKEDRITWRKKKIARRTSQPIVARVMRISLHCSKLLIIVRLQSDFILVNSLGNILMIC